MIRLWYHLTWYMMPILVASIIASGEFLVTYELSMNAYAAASKGPNFGSQRASLETQTQTQASLSSGVIFHEMEHVMHFTSPAWFNAAPGWFTEGLADYVCSIYGPQDDTWSMPPVQPTDSYNEAYAVAAHFLYWLDQHTTPHAVDRLSRAMLLGQSFPTVFYQLTGGTVDALWSQYEADSALKPFQCISAPDQLTSPEPVKPPNTGPTVGPAKVNVS